MIKNFLLVGFGGMLGTVLRYAICLVSGSQSFPYNTLIINITGSFRIGLVTAVALKTAYLTDWNFSWQPAYVEALPRFLLLVWKLLCCCSKIVILQL